MQRKRIGRYVIKEEIGHGGMSTIYLAHDPRSNRDVAVKILPPYFAHSEQYRERYKREATTIASLEHPAIVPIYDLGEDQGQPYIVMRYMSGGSLADRLKEGATPLNDVKTIVSRIATALDAAHAQGIVHRDIKPDNILYDSYGTVFLTDFGLARLREAPGLQNISDGFIMGTPAYMSPEQIQGQKELDGRSDIYSLAVVLYHMLTGKQPYVGATAASVMMMHLINPVPSVYEKDDSLPPALQSVLNIAMAKEPKDRYQTAGEMAKALEEVIEEYILSAEAEAKEESREEEAVRVPPTDWSKKATPIITMRFPELQDEAPVAELVPEVAPEARPRRAAPGRLTFPAWSWWAAALVLVGGMILLGSRLMTPAGATPAGSTQSQTSSGEAPILSPSPVPVVGGADQIAFSSRGEIWISNIDGSHAQQLTRDGTEKNSLQWAPGGKAVLYTSAECIRSFDLETRQAGNVVCFTGESSILAFQLSPDGQQIAISPNEQELYLVRFDLRRLGEIEAVNELTSLAECEAFAPYRSADPLKSFRWAPGGLRLAILTSHDNGGTARDGLLMVDFSTCQETPLLVGEIQPTYLLFSLRGYYLHPGISSFAWDGNNQVLLTGYSNPSGFGDLHSFDLQASQGQPLNPATSPCCYGDIQWSPDGRYWLFIYQPETGGEIGLYYIPWADLGSGATFQPLALPAGIFTAGEAPPQIALRPASPGVR
jgi:serine/threonine-protein kinase